MAKTHWREYNDTDHLGAYSLDNGAGGYDDIIATIKSIRKEKIAGAENKKEDVMVMYFHEAHKPMVVNATNAKTLEKRFKSAYVEDWIDKRIQIGVERVKAFGDYVDALRIRAFPPAPPKSAGPEKCSECDGEIKATEKMNAKQLVAFAMNKFGQVLCADCMRKKHEAEAPPKRELPVEPDEPAESIPADETGYANARPADETEPKSTTESTEEQTNDADA